MKTQEIHKCNENFQKSSKLQENQRTCITSMRFISTEIHEIYENNFEIEFNKTNSYANLRKPPSIVWYFTSWLVLNIVVCSATLAPPFAKKDARRRSFFEQGRACTRLCIRGYEAFTLPHFCVQHSGRGGLEVRI